MTIGRKLYRNFGVVLLMVVVLFLVNLVAMYRERAAKAAASQALQMADTTDRIRFQMMENRLYLGNYLLSGDSREVDRMNEGVRLLGDALQSAEKLSNSDQQRIALQQVEKNEKAWSTRICFSPLRKKKRCGRWQCDGCGTANFLLAKGRFFLGKRLNRILGCRRPRKQKEPRGTT